MQAASRWFDSRWAIAASGALLMATLGTIYSWSLFTQPLAASFGWSDTAVSWTFACAIFALGAGAVVGGRWQDRVGPRKVALIGALLWGAGNLLAGLGTAHFGPGWLYLTYGLIGGFGVGMGYVTPVAVVVKWFPDRRGLATGVVVTGFGLGGVFYNLIVKSTPSFAAAAKAAADRIAWAAAGVSDPAAAVLAPNHVAAVMNVFMVSGIAYMLLAGACAAVLRNPPAGSPAAGRASSQAASLTTREMLRSPNFYLLWLMLFLNVTAGILVISNAVPIMQELTGLAPAVVAAAYAGAALFNAVGRVFWGAVSDRLGCRWTFGLIFGIQALVFVMLGQLHGLLPVAAAFAVVLLCFGGGFGTMPSFAAGYFGAFNMGANYGVILTAWGAAGVVGPLFAAHVKDVTRSYTGALLPIACMLFVAILLPLVIRKPGASAAASAKLHIHTPSVAPVVAHGNR